jgi:hypothetical protein
MIDPDAKMPASLKEFISDPRTDGTPPVEACMPACDGGPWPETYPSGAIERQQIEFLAAYTRLNTLHDALRRVRATEQATEETPIVEALNQASQFRDQLEDRYAPIGFFGEPVMQGHLATNLVFHYAQNFVKENHRRFDPLDVCIKVPLPAKNLLEGLASIPGIPIHTVLADLRLPWRGQDQASKSQ